MKKYLLIIIVFKSIILNAQTIPFRLTNHNNLVVTIILNQKDTVNLMLHTGATDVTLIEDVLPKLKTVKFNGKVDSVKSWGSQNNTSDYSLKNTINIAGVDYENITIWKDQYSGPETDGKFGINLFKNKIIEFDFDKNQLRILEKLPDSFKKYQKYELVLKNDLMFLKAICKIGEKNIENEFMIHLGYAGDILLDDLFVNSNKVGEIIKITGENKLKDSFGNTVTTRKGILPILQIGKFQLKDIPVGFFEGTIGRQTISIMGGDVFKRFNWIFDIEGKNVYLKPNKNFKLNYSKI